jgi:hypothetical protein
MVATIATCAAAFIALSSWKQQRKHELRIEVFANSRSAMAMIRDIRNPISFYGEITDEVIEERNRINTGPATREEKAYMIFLTRAKKSFELYQQLLALRERIWAEYDENHIFYRFYDYIIKTNIEIRDAHQNCMMLRDRKTYCNPEDEITRSQMQLITVSMKGDRIETKMNNLFSDLMEERKKGRRI